MRTKGQMASGQTVKVLMATIVALAAVVAAISVFKGTISQAVESPDNTAYRGHHTEPNTPERVGLNDQIVYPASIQYLMEPGEDRLIVTHDFGKPRSSGPAYFREV